MIAGCIWIILDCVLSVLYDSAAWRNARAILLLCRLEQLVSDIIKRIEEGEVLYLHCWGGRGRAGTLGASTLARMYGLSAEEALVRVQKAFDTRQDAGRKSPETAEQIEFVKKFASKQS